MYRKSCEVFDEIHPLVIAEAADHCVVAGDFSRNQGDDVLAKDVDGLIEWRLQRSGKPAKNDLLRHDGVNALSIGAGTKKICSRIEGLDDSANRLNAVQFGLIQEQEDVIDSRSPG